MRRSSLLALPLLAGFVSFVTTCNGLQVGAGTSGLAAEPSRIVEAGALRVRLEPLAGPLEHPWGLAFLPQGGMLVTERPGRLRLVAEDGRLEPRPVDGVPAVWARGQGGLLDVALAPDFASSRRVYLSYAAAVEGGAATRVARARLQDHRLVGLEVVVTALPAGTTARHFGSRLVFGADGKLYVSTGERGQMDRAQRLDDLAGKILRLEPDGTVPPDNPFVGRPGVRPEIWAFGTRNAQGMVVHPLTGEILAHEHGARGGDEVNLVQRGANYGWPLVTHGVDYSGLPIGRGRTMAGVTDPLHVWVPSIAPSGLAVYAAERITGWKGSLLVGALAGEMLVRLEMDGLRVVREHRLLEGEIGRIRDVRVGPDGLVYLLTDAARGWLWRLGPASG